MAQGQRVQHAEVPPDSEIAVGTYWMRALPDQPRSSAGEPPGTASHLQPAARTERAASPQLTNLS